MEERLHVSVSRRSLFPLFMALFGALLCVGMIQRMRDPLYDMTLEYWLYFASGGLLVLVGLVGVRFFPWTCIIPAVCYVYGGCIEHWTELQEGGITTQVAFYQIVLLVPLILLLMGRWHRPVIWILKGLEIITILVPFALAYTQLQEELLELQMEGYLTDAVRQTRWMHFLMNEGMFYAAMICMTCSLRYLPKEAEVEPEEEQETLEETRHSHRVNHRKPQEWNEQPELFDAEGAYDDSNDGYDEVPNNMTTDATPFDTRTEWMPQQPMQQPMYPQSESGFAPPPERQSMPQQAPQVAPTPPQQHRGGAYPYNRPIHLPQSTDSDANVGDHEESNE